MSRVKISIIMPNFNGGNTIENSIKSFIENKYPNKELIIVDGKSQDNSHHVIQKYSSQYDYIKWINVKDRGISNAINIALNNISGDIVGYLGSDDLLNKQTLFKINDYKEIVDFDGIYFDSYTYYLNSNNIFLRKCPNIIFNKQSLIKHGTIVGLQNIFFDKRVYETIKYDEKNKYSMDYEIYFKIVNKFSNFIYVEYPATINLFDNNISHKLERRQTKEALQVMFKYIELKHYMHLPFRRIIHSFIRTFI